MYSSHESESSDHTPKQERSGKRVVKREKEQASTDVMQTPKKKRGRSTNDDEEDTECASKKATPSRQTAWSEEQEQLLRKLKRPASDGEGNQALSWVEIHKQFEEAFPHANKTANALRKYYQQKIKNSDVELTDEEIDAFKKAIADVEGPEKMAAISWRFEKLGGRPLNKAATSKLYKQYR